MMEKVIIIGAGGHGRVVIDAVLSNKDIEIIGFLDDGDINEVLGVKKLGNISQIEKFKDCKFHIAIGNNSYRKELEEKVGRDNLFTVIHLKAYISRDVDIGNGCYIGANTVINSKSKIGDLAIVNTGCIVEHDCILEKGSHLSYGVLLGSGAVVKENTYVEMGKIIERGKIVERDIR